MQIIKTTYIYETDDETDLVAIKAESLGRSADPDPVTIPILRPDGSLNDTKDAALALIEAYGNENGSCTGAWVKQSHNQGEGDIFMQTGLIGLKGFDLVVKSNTPVDLST